MYPDRYRLPQLTAHVLSLLDVRREGFTTWGPETEAALTAVAKDALTEAGRQFAELADDKPYWSKLEETMLTVVLPRYFISAKEQQALEAKKYGLWRGGDLLSRVAYGGSGLLAALLVWRTGIPEYFEPLPLAFFVLGPLLPDLQVWFAKRKYAKQVGHIVEAVAEEAALREQYRPLMEGMPSPIDQHVSSQTASTQDTRNKQGE